MWPPGGPTSPTSPRSSTTTPRRTATPTSTEWGVRAERGAPGPGSASSSPTRPKTCDGSAPASAWRRPEIVGAESIRWRCARCKVSVGQIDGHATGLPANWTRYHELYYCLSCRRAIAGETAVESASPGSSHDDLARLRRSAVIEFEID